MVWLLLIEENTEERAALASLLKRKGFMISQAGDLAGARSVLASSAPVEMVIAGAGYRDRGKLLSGLWEARPNVPVIFLASSNLHRSKPDRGMHAPVSMQRDLKFQIKMRPIAVEEIDRMIRIAAGKRRLDSPRIAAT